jgi:thiol:disulfide interchange protein DsbA
MRLSTIGSVAAFLLGLQLASMPVQAQSAGLSPPYFAINPVEKVTTTEKIEVFEIFSYGCIHCAQFQDRVDAWRKTLNTKKVEFSYLPSPYNSVDTLLARGYFAASTLGVVEKTHHGMFQAIHERGVQVASLNDVIALYAQLGVPAEQFSKAIKDFFVETQLRRTYSLMLKYKIDSTPTLIVAGKYRITSDSAGGQEAMLKVADQLIAQELAQSKATSRQAPSSGK